MVDNIKGFKTKAGILKYDFESLDNTPETFTPPVASTETLGGVKIDGSTITIDDGVISIDDSYASGLYAPSDGYIDIAVSTSGTEYTAPANGWLMFNKRCLPQEYVQLTNKALNMGVRNYNAYTTASTATQSIKVYLPIKKGSTAIFSYSATGDLEYARFIYAQGEI